MVGTLWIARGTPNSGLPEAFESLRVNVLSSYTLLCGSEYFRTRVPVALSRCHYRRPIENGYLRLNVNHLEIKSRHTCRDKCWTLCSLQLCSSVYLAVFVAAK